LPWCHLIKERFGQLGIRLIGRELGNQLRQGCARSHRWGGVSDSERAELFRQAPLVALPCIEASQSGIIPVAYTCAKPVVATDVGGLPEMVDKWADRILRASARRKGIRQRDCADLRNQDLAHALVANGQRKINTECSPAQVSQDDS
jgi:hypothetical protein